MDDISKCLISNFEIYDYKKCEDKSHGHEPFLKYKTLINNKEYEFGFCLNCISSTSKFIEENRNVILSLLLNGKEIPHMDRDERYMREHPYLLHKRDFENFIKSNEIPTSPNDKLDNLFINLSKLSNYDGEEVLIIHDIEKEEFYLKLYFKNPKELIFYLNTLDDNGLIDLKNNPSNYPVTFNLTYKGLSHLIDLQEEGKYSDRCFVAMSFDKDEEYLFDEVIEPICREYNFKAIRVDRIQPNSDQTINDLIIGELKKSKFVISDFTKNKNGVYFEAGYALGRGKKVIYSCHKDYFPQLHFDVNHFPILIYENQEHFERILRNKIEAHILE